MEPIEIPCGHLSSDGTPCGAKAGEPCRRRYGGRRPFDNPIYYHPERIADATDVPGIDDILSF